MSTILILSEPAPLDRIRSWALSAGLSCSSDLPFTNSLPCCSSMSASAASSRWAAMLRALSASLRATIAVAAPPTGVDREA